MGSDMHKLIQFKRIQHTLMVAFLLLSITPFVISALLFLNAHTKDLSTQTTNHLSSLLDNQHRQLTRFFQSIESEVQSFSHSELASASGGRFYGLIGAFNQLGDLSHLNTSEARQRYLQNQLLTKETNNTQQNYIGHERYRLMHNRYHWAFQEYLKRSDFTDIVLANLDGQVVYSVNSPELFSENLTNTFSDPELSHIFQRLQKVTQSENPPTTPIVLFSDYQSQKSGNDSHAWLAAPIMKQNYLHSYAFFKLDRQPLANLLQSTPDRGIQTLIIGEDHQSRLPNTSNVITTFNSESIHQALTGQSGVGQFINFNNTSVLSAFIPINVFGQSWALLVETPTEQAFARIQELQTFFIIAMIIAIILVIWAAHWISNSITAPLFRLTWAAEQVAAGDLDQEIGNTTRTDEIGRLATSFSRMQSSIRDKIALIHEKNEELATHIEIIQQKNQDLQIADKLKDDFLASTSVELKTPLHGMIGIAESLLMGSHGDLQRQQQHQLELVINSGQRLTNLVNDLVDYHKMRYGDLLIEKKPTDLASAISVVLELSDHLLSDKPIRIINQISSDIPLVIADEERLEQVLYHLVGNAIQYTHEGKIILSATILENKIRIQIVDTGQGMSNEQLEHIFEPLQHTHREHKIKRTGAGLGLSISRQLIMLMDGQVYISSQPQVGTTITFTLNLATQTDIQTHQHTHIHRHFQLPMTPQVQMVNQPNTPEIDKHKECVLVVDDDAINRQIFANFLTASGHRVLIAESGEQALKLMQQEQPALMLIDIVMPEMNGYELCQKIREQYDGTELPIIMLSALGQVKDRIKGFDCGANDYLSKPFNQKELMARVTAHLSTKRTQEKQHQNQILNEKLAQNEHIKEALITVQARLLGLLNTNQEAILGIKGDGRIRYANASASQLFERPLEQLVRAPIAELLFDEHTATIQQDPTQWSYNIGGIARQLPTHILELPTDSEPLKLFIFDIFQPSDKQRTNLMESALSLLANYAMIGDKQHLQQLRELGGEYTRLADTILKPTHNKTEHIRDLVVSIMLEALQHWSLITKKSKFDLAEESGLWRVYLDRSTLQTRTLDKYLHIDTLPKTPRWRIILSTVDFVLTRSSSSDSSHQRLVQKRDQLKHLLSE